MTETTDPTFYRTPGDAIAAAPEALAYVAASDPRGVARDAIAVLDCDPVSPVYGKVVGWADMPTGGNELHHFGWNACSSALCHGGHAGQLERRYLVVPGLRSSRTYILDTKPERHSSCSMRLGIRTRPAQAISKANPPPTRPRGRAARVMSLVRRVCPAARLLSQPHPPGTVGYCAGMSLSCTGIPLRSPPGLAGKRTSGPSAAGRSHR